MVARQKIPRHIEIGVMFKVIVDEEWREQKLQRIEIGSRAKKGVELVSEP